MFAVPNFVRLCLAAFLAASLLTSAAHAQKWGRLAPFPEASEELYGVAANGKFYAFGGLAPAWTPKGLMYEYDPEGDTWTKKKNMPLALHHPAWVELNGKIYLFGGFTKPEKGPSAWVPIDNAWEYDPRNLVLGKNCQPLQARPADRSATTHRERGQTPAQTPRPALYRSV